MQWQELRNACREAAESCPVNAIRIEAWRAGAMTFLHLVQSPTLFIVGGEDRPVIPLNESAYKRLNCPKEMVIVPGATHLFEEPGTLERVAELARDWFLKYFLPQR